MAWPKLRDRSGAPTARIGRPHRHTFQPNGEASQIRLPWDASSPIPTRRRTGASIAKAVAAMATHLSSARCDGLEIGNPYGFGVAFKPIGDDTEILTLAASVVELTDRLRAPLTLDDIAQRERNENLNPRQREYLHRWGYPMVMEELSFQLTLSNRITPEVQPIMEAAVARHFEGLLPMPFVIEDLCLFGEEAKSGMFRLVHRYRLSG